MDVQDADDTSKTSALIDSLLNGTISAYDFKKEITRTKKTIPKIGTKRKFCTKILSLFRRFWKSESVYSKPILLFRDSLPKFSLSLRSKFTEAFRFFFFDIEPSNDNELVQFTVHDDFWYNIRLLHDDYYTREMTLNDIVNFFETHLVSIEYVQIIFSLPPLPQEGFSESKLPIEKFRDLVRVSAGAEILSLEERDSVNFIYNTTIQPKEYSLSDTISRMTILILRASGEIFKIIPFSPSFSREDKGDDEGGPGAPIPKISGDPPDTPATLNRKLKDSSDRSN